MTKNTTPNDARAADSARRIADGRSAPSAARAKYVISAPENKEREENSASPPLSRACAPFGRGFITTPCSSPEADAVLRRRTFPDG